MGLIKSIFSSFYNIVCFSNELGGPPLQNQTNDKTPYECTDDHLQFMQTLIRVCLK